MGRRELGERSGAAGREGAKLKGRRELSIKRETPFAGEAMGVLKEEEEEKSKESWDIEERD